MTNDTPLLILLTTIPAVLFFLSIHEPHLALVFLLIHIDHQLHTPLHTLHTTAYTHSFVAASFQTLLLSNLVANRRLLLRVIRFSVRIEIGRNVDVAVAEIAPAERAFVLAVFWH